MIKVSSAALEQIAHSSEQGKAAPSPLRIAVKEQDDGSFHYAMGFDDQRLPGDTFLTVETINIVISETSKTLCEGMTVDYVELEPGKNEFIFLNPNDPTYVAPKK